MKTAQRLIASAIVFAAALVIPGAARLDAQQLATRHFSSDDGLIQNDVLCLHQDSRGCLWIGTYSGLSRFDGKRFISYDEQSAGLKGNTVYAVSRDRQNSIWAGYNGGLGRLQAGRFVHYGPADGLLGECVITLCADPRRGVWCATEKGVNYFDGSRIVTYPLKDMSPDYSVIALNAKGAVYAATDSGLLERAPGAAGFTRLPGAAFPVVGVKYCRRDGRLYVISRHSLYVMENGAPRLLSRAPFDDRLVNLFFDPAGAVWAVSEEHLWKYSQHGSTVYTARDFGGYPFSCGGLVDREGNMWVGHWGGVSLVLDECIRNYQDNLPGRVVTSIQAGRGGRLWIAGEEGLVSWNAGGQPEMRIEAPYVSAFRLDDSRSMLYAATTEGLHVFDTHGRLCYSAATDEVINSLHRDADGTVWLGTERGLLSVRNQKLRREADISSGLGSNIVWAILRDAHGRLWAGTESGLSWSDGEEWHTAAEPRLSHSCIWTMFSHPQWGVLIGTQRGITQFKDKTFRVLPFLRNEVISSFACDQTGRLWVGTESGLYRIESTGSCGLFLNKTRGLVSNAAYVSCLTLHGGHLYLGTYNGMSRISTSITAHRSPPPVLCLSGVKINRAPERPSVLSAPLPHFKNNITFDFQAVHLYLPDSVTYRYYLEGLDSRGWGRPTAIPRAVYTNLSPGRYRFHVQSTAGSGTKSSPVAVPFCIQPPWWRHPAGIAALLLASGLFAFGSVRWTINRRLAKSETERRRLQALYEKQIELDRLKDEFLANTSHELRTPLNGIIGLARSLRDGDDGPLTAHQDRSLSLIYQSSRRLYTLVNDILDFSRIKRDGLELHLKPVDVKSIVDVVCAVARPLIGHKNVSLRAEVSGSLPLVCADENRLQQILYNLVGNAIKFTPEGVVMIRAAADQGGVVLTVSDTGIGIAPDKQERIFAPFEQADGSVTRLYGGTGIGLSVTRQLVELHGSTITVDSAEGAGASFSFRLPAAAEDGAAADTGSESPAPESGSALPCVCLDDAAAHSTFNEAEPAQASDGPLILIVDDEPLNVEILERHLARAGYRTLCAGDGYHALSLLEKEPPDLILLDLMMPRMSGYELCSRIRRSRTASELPILMLTAKDRIDDLLEGFACGASDYVMKPYHRDELLTRIRTHVQIKQTHRAYARFVPHEFLRHLQKESIVDVQLGDCVSKEMTVLFSDIRSFTALSEKMSPKENFRFLNNCLSMLAPVIAQGNGFIDKYIGDAVMALFERPDDAVDTALNMRRALEEHNRRRAGRGEPALEIGIGINTGALMLGTVGVLTRMDGTVISDAVNLSSRIEELTKQYGVPLLVSGHTRDALCGPGRHDMRLAGRVTVKGRTEPVTVYEVYSGDPDDVKAAKKSMQDCFEKAVMLYNNSRFDDAADLFHDCLGRSPSDSLCRFYVSACYIKQNRINNL